MSHFDFSGSSYQVTCLFSANCFLQNNSEGGL